MSKEMTLEDAYTYIGKLIVENDQLKAEKNKYWDWYLEERTAMRKLEEELSNLKKEISNLKLDSPGSDFDADIKKEINDNLD